MAISPRQPGDKVQSAPVDRTVHPTGAGMDPRVYDPAGHKQDIFGYIDRRIQDAEISGGGGGGGTGDVTKLSQLENDVGFVDATGAAAAAPVQSVNSKVGPVVLAATDVYAVPIGSAMTNQEIEELLSGGNG